MSDTTTMQTMSLDEAANDFLNLFNGTPTEIELFKAGAEWQTKQQLPEIALKEPVNFLLANALKLCNEKQLIALRDSLVERTPKKQVEYEYKGWRIGEPNKPDEKDGWLYHSSEAAMIIFKKIKQQVVAIDEVELDKTAKEVMDKKWNGLKGSKNANYLRDKETWKDGYKAALQNK